MTRDERFSEARLRTIGDDTRGEGIGRLSEKSQHKILKYYLEPNEENHEVKYLGSVADIKNEQGIFEIQTRAHEKLIPKLKKFLPMCPVTVVLPLAAEKTVSWVSPETHEISAPKKSPKHEDVLDALLALSKISPYFAHPNFRLKLIYLSVSEYRYLNGWDKSGKRGSTRLERIPNRLLDEKDINNADGLRALLPEGLDGEFTAAEFYRFVKRKSRAGYYMLRFLIDHGMAERSGERGRAYLYRFIK